MVIMNLDVDLAMSSLWGTSTGTRQGGGMSTFSNIKVTLLDLKVDFGAISLEGTSSGTRQGEGVGDVLVILYVDLVRGDQFRRNQY